MAEFFIDTRSGQVATKRQLVEAGVAPADTGPERPWLRIQGTNDASTMWYAVLRRRERGIWLGSLVMRHQDHYERLLADGWEEVPIEEISARGAQAMAPPDAPSGADARA
jgi:hypothetical protein